MNHGKHIHPNTVSAREKCVAATTPIPVGAQVEVRYTGSDGKTHSWLVKLIEQESAEDLTAYIGPGDIRISGWMQGGTMSSTVDARLEGQKVIIDRLLAHVKYHCPDFSSGLKDLLAPKCDFNDKQEEGR